MTTMSRIDYRRPGILALALGLTACGGPPVPELVALPGMEESVPEITEVTNVIFETTAGDVNIAVFPEAAPNAAARFLELVESGFYDDTPVFRIVPGFVAQFGINWREPHREWLDRMFNDDPTYFQLLPGTLAFAKAGLNTNSTQIFVSFRENNYLAAPDQGFSVFAAVAEGMDIVESFADVGELSQPRLRSNGDAYLESLPEQPTMIVRARID
jgi:cyclophilin family peptidyl-prolyl cis-trans isomerase